MCLTPAGRIVADAWLTILGRHPDVRVVASAIMPDHVDVLLALDPTGGARKSVSRLVGAVKTYSAARINRARGTPALPVRQRGFHDWILRTPAARDRVCVYIANNPRRWVALCDDPMPS